jgi:transcriptional regulator with XRE-family HTH domain
MPAGQTAARSGDVGTVLRQARQAAGLTLEQAGRIAGFSPSTLSRAETGHRRMDVAELRRLADVYRVPPDMLGLSSSTETVTDASLAVDQGGEAMRRRDLLAAAAAGAVGASLGPLTRVAAADGLAGTVADVLYGRTTADPVLPRQLAAQLAAARSDFAAVRYTQLARRLPRLLAQASATCDAAGIDQVAAARTQLAAVYNLTTELLVKLHEDAMAWATVDRAVNAAHAGADPLTAAEADRMAAIVMRRTQHRDRAQAHILDAARRLDDATGLASPEHARAYAGLLATAAYTVSMRDDRDLAWSLIDQAETACRRAGATGTLVKLAMYKVGIARQLGDYGIAVDHARRVDPAQLATPERRARYWEDTALALHGRGRPSLAWQALQAAEQAAPQEVRFRPWAQQLARDLLSSDHRGALPGLRSFADRIGVLA